MNKLLADFAKKPLVPSAVVNGVMGVTVDEDYSSTESENDEYEQYEQEYVVQEMRKYATFSTDGKKHNDASSQDMCDVDGVDGIHPHKNAYDVYETYNFSTTFIKKELPIDSVREKIISLVEVNNVVIVQGATGCGKTTQVPQFILDDSRNKKQYCNIAVTQPRKIATINVARRVCEERGWTLGAVCGYQVGLEKKLSPDMLLTYMTTGVLLQKIIQAKSLHQFTHIIIDEVHERNQELDFLLLVVRRFLFTNSPKTKIILMSATIEAEEFAHYFRCQTLNAMIPAPIIYVNKKSCFTKTIFYIEQFANTVDAKTIAEIPKFDVDKPEISEGVWKIFLFLVSVIDKLDGKNPRTNAPIIGSVLVFLPGLNEIEEANRRLLKHFEEERTKKLIVVDQGGQGDGHGQGDGKSKGVGEEVKKIPPPLIKWEIIPLHSSLPNDEQAKVFKPPAPGYRKVILSTNIAESSITVPDSYYVIDFCQTKVMTVDPVTKYMSLKLEWASHVNCEQRAGRVGRIGNGRIYRLVPRGFYQDKLSKRSAPEIIRAPLERVILQAKMLNLNDTPQQILALALNPPNLKNIENTLLTLKEIGALLQTCRGIVSTADGDLTFLGTVMASLPIDVRLSKLIVLGHLFSCLEEATIIAAGCSIQNIFSIPFQQRFNAYKKLLVWADGSSSDLISLLNLFQVWQSCKRDNNFENWQAEHRWCIMNLVSLKGLKEWSLLVTEIKQRLESMNIKPTTGQNRVVLSPVEKPLILKVITAGAFYPNYFVKVPDEIHLDEREAVKVVGGRDPSRTVYLTGMDPSQPGPLYIRAIKKMLRSDNDNETDFVIGFDGSSKVYVEFKTFDRKLEQVAVKVDGFQRVTNTIPGKIPLAVYEAIRKRQLNHVYSLKLLPSQEAWEWAERYGIKRNSTLQTYTAATITEERNCYSETEYSPIPPLDMEWITLKITEHIDAAHFWANTIESEHFLGKIEEILNKQILHPVIKTGGTPKMGKVYAAKYHEDKLFYRCSIISYGPNITQVLFIDYGNIQQVSPKDIYFLPPDRPECNLPPLGIECVLHGVQPSLKFNRKGIWDENVNNIWMRQTAGVLLYGKVHSVVDNVIYLELFKNQYQQIKSINQQMLEQGVAEVAADSFLSKADHDKRMRVLKAENPNIEAVRLSFDKVINYQDFEAPEFGANCKTIELKGPNSPLEMKVYGCIQSAANKVVDIDGSSVNTVLLDTEKQNMHTRLLVAGYVGQTGNGDRLRLRQTSMLPSIPGLPMLLSLLFCPTMRVKLTEDGTRVASILCGLGYNEYTSKPYYPSHDLTLTLDTELTEDEVNKINQVRFYLNQGVKLMYEISQDMSSEEEMIRTQNCLKKELTDLIYISRKPVDRINVKYENVWAKNIIDAVVLKPNMCDDQEDIWPLLWFVKLNSMQNYNPNLCKNLDDLDLMARNMIPIRADLMCELCLVPLQSVYEIRYHLISHVHKEAVKVYYETVRGLQFDDEEDD